MKKLLAQLIFLLFIGSSAYSQCAFNNTFAVDLTPSGPGATATDVCVNGGEFVTVNVILGETYIISTCNSSLSFDTEITLYDAAGATVLGYDDDFCAPYSQVTYLATYTGVLNVLIDEFSCLSNASCAQLDVTRTAPCAANAGTVAVLVDGSPVASPVNVCFGSCISITSNDDYVLPTPVVGEVSELMYAIYTCLPTTVDPNVDPCFSGFFWTGEDFADCNDPSSILVAAGLGSTLYFAPVTMDDSDNGGSNGVIGIDNNGDACFDVGNAIQLTYLANNAGFNYGAASYCANASDPSPTITGLAGGTFTSSPAGLSINAATGTVDISASTVGAYTITYTTAGACSNSSDVSFSINPLPVMVATNNGPICSGTTIVLDETGGDAVAWNWTTSGASTIINTSDQSPTVSSGINGETFTVTGIDINGCAGTAQTTITVIPQPVIAPYSDVTACGTFALPAITGTNLTGNEAYYNNSQANGGTVITGDLTTSQTVWVFDGNAPCFDEVSFDVTILPLPTVVSFTGGANYCTGDAIGDILVDVSGSANWTLNYSLDGIAQTITASSNPINLGNTPGVYTLIDLSDATCSDVVSGTQTITVNPVPLAPTAGTDATYCSGSNFDAMTATGSGGTITWYADMILSDVISTGTTLVPDDVVGTMTYYVTETTTGCEGPASQVVITVNSCDILVPTAFTPDNDTYNDVWDIGYLDLVYPENQVSVYNRWGELVYVSDKGAYALRPWDGSYKGELLPVGSYYYIIEFNNDAEEDSDTGTVSIILR